MGILSFEKPKKVRSTEEHNNTFMSDSGIAGTYVPNMSKEDKERWKGKHIKGDDERIEIRKSLNGVQMLIVVYRRARITPTKDWRERQKDHNNIRISMNGKVDMLFHQFEEMQQVIEEAKEILRIDDISVGDTVELPLDEEGIVERIETERLDWFPYKVRITKGGTFNQVGDLVEFKSELILKK